MTRRRKPLDLIGMIGRRTRSILVVAAIGTLIGLALMMWSMAQPTPMPVILAMSLGQGVGILAFVLFGLVVVVDQLHQQREAGARDAARSSGAPASRPAAPSREASP